MLVNNNLNNTIALEVKEEHLDDTLETEKKIIGFLNETILPALEATVSHCSIIILCYMYDYNFLYS